MRWVTLVVLLAFTAMVSGCASQENWDKYYALQESRTQAIVDAMNQQAALNRRAAAQEMTHFSTAAAQAAITPSPSDDVLVSFAWGYKLGQPDVIKAPSFPSVPAPPSNLDYLKTAIPLVGMVMPFAYMWAATNNSGGATYQATDNAKINLNSENSGSYNSSGGDMGITNTDNKVENDCLGCENPDDGLGTEGEPINPIAGGETCEEGGGYFNSVNGKYYADEFFTCSCGSRDAGEC